MPDKALSCLKKAVEAESLSSSSTLEVRTEHAGTLLNMCAIQSQMGNHSDAIKAAKQALSLLENSTVDDDSSRDESYHLMRLAGWYNLGIEQDHEHHYGQAVTSLQKGLSSEAKMTLGDSHPLVMKTRQALSKIERK